MLSAETQLGHVLAGLSSCSALCPASRLLADVLRVKEAGALFFTTSTVTTEVEQRR